MKKVIKKSFVLLVLFTSLLSFAKDYSNGVNDIEDNITNLTLSNVKEGSILWIKNQNGLLIYKERIEKSGNYSKGFDLTALPNGDYSFELEKETAIKVIPFQVKSNIVSFKKEAEKIIFKPIFIENDEVMMISKIVKEGELVEVKIYFENSELVFEESFKDINSVRRSYDFSTSEKGNYEVTIKSEGRLFSKKIAIK